MRKSLLFITFMLTLTLQLKAYDFEKDNFYYLKITGEDKVVVTYGPRSQTYYINTVTLPETVEIDGKTYTVNGIGDSAFSGLTGLTGVNLHDKIEKIGNSAFHNTRINTLVIPESVAEIGKYAFSDCISLQTIKIPAGVKTLSKGVFAGTGFQTFDIPETIEILEEGIFAESSLRTISIPENITFIPEYCFEGCKELQVVNLPASLKNIKTGAFSGCEKISEITLPDNLTEIGGLAFTGCKGLKTIEIPAGVKILAEKLFYGSGLASIHIPESINRLEEGVFSSTNLHSISFPESITVIPIRCFDQCKQLTTVSFHEKVTEIGAYAFSECDRLESVRLPESIRVIDIGAFRKCILLKEINLPNTIEEIGSSAFSYCRSLESVRLPEKLEKISDNLFNYCPYLKFVSIPPGIKEVKSFSFSNCQGLRYIELPWENLSQVITETDAFFNTDTKNITLFIPQNTTNMYWGNFVWGKFGDYIEGRYTSLPTLLTTQIVNFSGGILTLNTPTTETITICSPNGEIIFQTRKPAGEIKYSLPLHPGIRIVRGSSGWIKKIKI